jgi:hypothetical protein
MADSLHNRYRVNFLPMPRTAVKVILAGLLICLPLFAFSQTKRKSAKKAPAKPTETAVTVPDPSPSPEPSKKNQGKANSRPDKQTVGETTDLTPTYIYTFDRPGFTYSSIRIEHDDSGKGRISMKRDGYGEVFTDPVQLSSATMGELRKAFDDLHFVDSTEDYQYPGRDYSHLGNVTITRRVGERERTAKFNWTEKKAAKALMDEYRDLANEYTWRLEMISARENQPLLAPGLMETFDGYIQRNEISDPPHVVPFLIELSQDERIPLIARNRASRIIERIQKAAKH